MNVLTDPTDTFTDLDWEIVDALIENALRSEPRQSYSPSAAARKAGRTASGHRVTTSDAHRVLPALVTARMALASGNGAWTRYSDYDRRYDPTLTGQANS